MLKSHRWQEYGEIWIRKCMEKRFISHFKLKSSHLLGSKEENYETVSG
jgi:hypothetical protein